MKKICGLSRSKGTDMNKNRILNTLLATTFIGGAMGIASPAFAQDNPGTQGGTTGQPQTGPVEASTPTTSANGNPAAAQDQGAIVITGSRIPQPNLTAVSPVTVVNSQEVKLQGTSRTEDLINSLPQAFAEQGGNLANGATGTATVNLRGLGSNRTLVLINGRRLVPGDPSFPSPDINIVPASMIDRVDVLTGGASSVYGSDAVAGVVNFIMDTKFEGIKLDGQYSFFNHDNGSKTGIIAALNGRNFGYPHGTVADGGTIDLSAQIGAGFDDGRGHVVAYATYRKINPVLENKRDYSSCAIQARSASQRAKYPGPGSGTAGDPLFFCGGSATSANGTVFAFTGSPAAGTFTSTTFQIGPNRTLIGGSTPFNFAPYNYYQRPDERYTAGAFANYEISPALKPYLEFMFMDDRTLAQIAPSGDFGNTFSVNCDNPLLSAQQRSIICAPNNLISSEVSPITGLLTNNPVGASGAPPQAYFDPTTGQPYFRGFAQILRRNVEGGGRIDDLQHTTYRGVLGMRGDLSNVWSYDAYYQYARVNFSETYLNDFSVARLNRALDVINIGGVPTCRSVRDGSDPNCVPYDVWGGTISPAALNYLQTPGFQRGQVEQAVAEVSVTGKLGEYGLRFPWAEDGVGIALGAQYRKDKLNLNTDEEFQTGDLAGQGAATLPAHGAFDVRELFGEIRIPIVENNFFQSLAVEAGYRRSSYELKGGVGHGFKTDTWKVGLDFAPVRDIRLRASYNRAVRAPNIQELFATQHVALNGNSDPCAKTITAADTGCLAQGLHVGQTVNGNPAGQYNGLVGGNPNLLPETATTKSAGLVIQPRFLPRFALTVDWFDIKVKDAIQQIGQDTILSTCVKSGGSSPLCALIHRDNFGSLWRSNAGFVTDITQNIGGVHTRGVDFGFSYSRDIGSLGGLSLNAVGTWLDKLITDSGVGSKFDCAGLYGLQCTTPNPTWRHKVRLTWAGPDGIGMSFQWRYFKSVDLDISDHSQPDLSSDGKGGFLPFSPLNAKIPSQNYFDLAFTARIGDHYNFRLGVNNIFDREPPIIGSNGSGSAINACPGVYCSGNTFPNVYDPLGRYIFAGVTLDF
jgi:outer membrane receptor protein involved in Fe transport